MTAQHYRKCLTVIGHYNNIVPDDYMYLKLTSQEPCNPSVFCCLWEKLEVLQLAIPSSGAELSAELLPSELPDVAALFTFFLAALFFSVPLPGLTFFFALVPPTVH